LAIVFRCGMDVVRRRVVVLDLDGLASHYAEHMGMIFASALIEYDGVFGDVEGTVPQAIFHKHKDVREIAIADVDRLGFVRALAPGILTHIDLGWLRSRSIELYGAADGSHGRRIDRSCRGGSGWLFSGVAGLLGVLFLAARPQSQQCAESQHAD